MEYENELEQKAVAISKVEVDATQFVLKLKLIKCGPIVQVRTNPGVMTQKLVFVDEEGSKIQSTIDNEFSGNWKIPSQLSKVFYVINGKMNRSMSWKNVNKFKELSVTQSTQIKECNTTFATRNFSEGFTALNNLDNVERKMKYDVVGVLIEKSEIITRNGRKVRNVIITDESLKRIRVTLWDENATHDASCLDGAKNGKSVISFTSLTASVTNGLVKMETDGVTSVFVNPIFERAVQLMQWNNDLIRRNINIIVEPSLQYTSATEMKLNHILDSTYDNTENVFCKFNATIKEVIKKHKVCYHMCKQCSGVADIENDQTYCMRCRQYEVPTTYIYFLELVLQINNEMTTHQVNKNGTGYQTITVKVFESGATFLLGCNANKFMQSIAEKGQASKYYQNMLKAEGKTYSFMVRNYTSFPQQKRMTELQIEEMHIIDNGVIDLTEQAEASTTRKRKMQIERKETQQPTESANRVKRKIMQIDNMVLKEVDAFLDFCHKEKST